MAGKTKTSAAESSVASEVSDSADAVESLARELFIQQWRMQANPQYSPNHLPEQCFDAAEAFLAHAATRREVAASV